MYSKIHLSNVYLLKNLALYFAINTISNVLERAARPFRKNIVNKTAVLFGTVDEK